MIALLDYGSGNLRSAERALATTGREVLISADFETCLNADGLVVPGVGAFGKCIAGLRSVRGDELILRRFEEERPTLGICVGMQVLFAASDESPGVNGLGIFPTVIERLESEIVPHMGWNRVDSADQSTLFNGLEGELFYFVHSFASKSDGAGGTKTTPGVKWSTTQYEERFAAALEYGSLSATQFHPEKSGDVGLQLLDNWVNSW